MQCSAAAACHTQQQHSRAHSTPCTRLTHPTRTTHAQRTAVAQRLDTTQGAAEQQGAIQRRSGSSMSNTSDSSGDTAAQQAVAAADTAVTAHNTDNTAAAATSWQIRSVTAAASAVHRECGVRTSVVCSTVQRDWLVAVLSFSVPRLAVLLPACCCAVVYTSSKYARAR